MDMTEQAKPAIPVPSWNLYGEEKLFPDVLHTERIHDRAAGLGWVIAPHRHPHLHQFFLITCGQTELQADGQRFEPQAPFVLSVPKGIVHGFVFSVGTEGYVLTLPPTALPEVFGTDGVLARNLATTAFLTADRVLVETFDRIHAEQCDRAPGRPLMLTALAMQIACLFVRQLPDWTDTATRPIDPRVQRYLDLVELHARDHWTMDRYAGEIGVSARQLGRLCIAETGAAPGALAEATLMREARRMLAYTRASVAAIAFDLGFDDPAYFSRAFRRHIGLSPTDYRKRLDSEGRELTAGSG